LSVPRPSSTIFAPVAFFSVFSTMRPGSTPDGASVDVDAHRRVALEQFLGAFGQLVGMRRQVLAGDHQARLLVAVGVDALAAAFVELGRQRRQAAGPGGNRAVLVAGLLGADGRERGAQLLGLIGRDARPGGAGNEGDGSGGGQRQPGLGEVHRMAPQKVVLKVSDTSRDRRSLPGCR